MVKNATPHRLPTVEEYLEIEEAATVRHEYVGGMIYAMVGVTKRHNRIAPNIATRLLGAARSGPCRVYTSDVKVRIGDDVMYYPDVMVACGPEGDHPLIEDAPCLIVEVISPSTESIDRREKVFNYRKMPSLKAYLVVDQNRRWVERHWCDEKGEWRQGGLADEGVVPIPCPEEFELSLEEIYEGL